MNDAARIREFAPPSPRGIQISSAISKAPEPAGGALHVNGCEAVISRQIRVRECRRRAGRQRLIEQWLEDDRRHGYRMTKPYARGATRGEEGRISFSGSGAKTPEAPLRAQESGPISGSPLEMSVMTSYRTSMPSVIPRRFRGCPSQFRGCPSRRAKPGVPSRTNYSRTFPRSMSRDYRHGVTTFWECG